MNRVEFMKELRAGIVKLPYQEAEAALEYYEEYFDEAGPENEERAINELGDPTQIAKQIMDNFSIKETEVNLNDIRLELDMNKASETPPKMRVNSVWMIILAIVALPIAFPLAFGAIMLFVGIEIVVFAFGIVSVAFGAAGIISFVAGIGVLSTQLMTGLFVIGLGFVLCGLAIAVGIGTCYSFKFVNLFVVKGIDAVVNREKDRRR